MGKTVKQVLSGFFDASHAGFMQQWMQAARKTMAAALLPAAAILMAALPAQSSLAQSSYVPPVVATSQITLATGINPGKAVLDNCGNIYEMEGGSGNVLEIPAGGGTPVKVTTGVGYNQGGLAIDSAGANLYLVQGSDFYSSGITRVPITACVPQPGSAARFGTNFNNVGNYYWNTASDIAVDPAGDVFFATFNNCCGANNNTVLEETAAGTPVIVLATYPNQITSIAADSSGNLYFTDGSSDIFIVPSGKTAPSTFATGFVTPSGLTFDKQGNLYVTDTGNKYANPVIPESVYEIPLEGSTLTVADKFLVATGVGVGHSVGLDASNNLYIAPDYGGSGILSKLAVGSAVLPSTAIGATSATSTVNYVFNATVKPAAINFVSGAAASKAFAASGTGCGAGTTYDAGQSCSIAATFTPSIIGQQTGAVVLADSTGAAINTTALAGVGLGSIITVTPGTATAVGKDFAAPAGAAVDSLGNIYVADSGANTVTEFAAGSTTGTAISTGTIQLNAPGGVAIDGVGNIFIADTGNNQIVEVPVINGVVTGASAVALGTGLKSPAGVAVDGAGNLYIADSGNDRLLFVPNHNGALDFTLQQSYGTGLKNPLAVTVDASGNVYVADSGNNQVLALHGPIGSEAQTKIATGLNNPSAVATDASGSLYVVDQGDLAVLKYPKVGGSLGLKVQLDISVASPYGLAIDASGNLFVTDSVDASVTQVSGGVGSLAFGAWNVGTTSTPLTATVFNSGNQSLTFPSPSFTVSGNTGAGFKVSSDGCATAATLAAGAGCDITASFTPPVTELDATETLSLLSNATVGGESIVLSGTGAHITPSTLSLVLTSPAAGTPINAGSPVSFTATINTGTNTATAGGTVKFSVQGSQVGVVKVVNSAATITLPNGLPAGNAVVISAAYSGDQINYSGSTASITEDVIGLPTSLVLTITTPYVNPQSVTDNAANPTGPSIPLTATIVGTGTIIPSGSVNFYSTSGGPRVLLGTGIVGPGAGSSYQATITTTALRAGTTNTVENYSTLTTYSITAVYSGDSTYDPSTAPGEYVEVLAPPVKNPACVAAGTCAANTTGAALQLTPSSLNITVDADKIGEGSGSAQLTLVSLGGWSGVVSFNCSGLPLYAICKPVPGQVTVNPSTPGNPAPPAQIPFYIYTNVAPAPTKLSTTIWWTGALLGLAMLMMRRRLMKSGYGSLYVFVGVVLLMGASIGGMMGCGSSGNKYITPAGTSDITVTVNAAQLQANNTNGTLQLNDSNTGTFHIALTVK